MPLVVLLFLLTFFFFLAVDRMNLTVYMNESGILSPLWNRSGNQGDVWQEMMIDFTSSSRHQVGNSNEYVDGLLYLPQTAVSEVYHVSIILLCYFTHIYVSCQTEEILNATCAHDCRSYLKGRMMVMKVTLPWTTSSLGPVLRVLNCFRQHLHLQL